MATWPLATTLPRPFPPSRPLLKRQAGTRFTMFTTQPSLKVKMPQTLRFAEEDPEAPKKKIVFGVHHAFHCAEPGVSYPSYLGPLTVLRITDSEVFYFQGGFIYFIDSPDFLNLLKSQSLDIFGTGTQTPGTRFLTELEVEFILGILATVGPQACWMFLGNDLAAFIAIITESALHLFTHKDTFRVSGFQCHRRIPGSNARSARVDAI